MYGKGVGKLSVAESIPRDPAEAFTPRLLLGPSQMHRESHRQTCPQGGRPVPAPAPAAGLAHLEVAGLEFDQRINFFLSEIHSEDFKLIKAGFSPR